MTALSIVWPFAPPRLVALSGAGLATAAVAWWAAGAAADTWLLVFVVLAGFAVGSLGLLMIGHLMSEVWLKPIRSETEAAALTTPLLTVVVLPLAFSLGDLYPWASGASLGLPRPRAVYLSPAFFLIRSSIYLAVWTALAFWIVRTPNPRRASAIGLALLTPTATFAANDWVLSRDPLWWSSLFGFSFALSQLLAALAGGILVSLLRPEHPSPGRMQSLERALLTLTLLVLWAWFVQFLIVWLANLPHEAAWYLARSGPLWLWLLAGAVLPALLAVAILAPPGFGRRTMIIGSALLLLQHASHMTWLVRPAAWSWTPWDIAAAIGLGAAWAGWFAAALMSRPADDNEPDEASGLRTFAR